MRITFANDHAGAEMRGRIIEYIKNLGHEVIDCGSDNEQSVDYPDYGALAVRAVTEGRAERAILLCGTGLGMCIVANKFPGIRCGTCTDLYTAKMSRTHNDTNVLSLRARNMELEKNLEIIKVWLEEEFEGGRHERRLAKISEIEREVMSGLERKKTK
jgi:ribose 5-phosphate isomerase B